MVYPYGRPVRTTHRDRPIDVEVHHVFPPALVQEDVQSIPERVLRERQVHFLKLPQESISLP